MATEQLYPRPVDRGEQRAATLPSPPSAPPSEYLTSATGQSVQSAEGVQGQQSFGTEGYAVEGKSYTFALGTDKREDVYFLTHIARPFFTFEFFVRSVPKRQSKGGDINIVTFPKDAITVHHLLQGDPTFQIMTYMNSGGGPVGRFDQEIVRMSSDVWVYLGPDSLADDTWTDKVRQLVARREGNINELSLPKPAFCVKFLLESESVRATLPPDLKRVPVILKDDDCVDFMKDIHGKKQDKIEEHFKDKGPVHVVRLTLHTDGDDSYTKASYTALGEVLQDPASYVRQELHQLYKTPNVLILGYRDPHYANGMYVELRPLDVVPFEAFLTSCEDDTFAIMVAGHLKVRGGLYRGVVDIVHQDDVNDVLQQLRVESEADVLRKGMSLKSLITTKMYVEALNNPHKTPWQFVQDTKSVHGQSSWTDVCDIFGLNALHLAIEAKRMDYLWYIFYSNLWGQLRVEVIHSYEPALHRQSKNSRKGYNPHRLAQAFSFRPEGYDVLCEFEYIDQLWLSLPFICRACLQGATDIVKIAVEYNPAYLCFIDINHNTPLTYACASGNSELVRYLLAKDVPQRLKPINSRNRRGDTALNIAAMFGHSPILGELFVRVLQKQGPRNAQGYNALDYLAINGNISCLRRYKDKCALDPHVLTAAVKFQRYSVMEFLFKECEVNPNEGLDSDKRCSLHHAVINGDYRALALLLDEGADIRLRDHFGKSVFHLVAEHNHPRVLDRLIAHAKDKGILEDLVSSQDFLSGKEDQFLVRGKDKGRRAWHWIDVKPLHMFAFHRALRSGQIDVATHGSLIMSAFGGGPTEADLKKIKDRQDTTLRHRKLHNSPLHVAVAKDHLEIVERLVACGADVNCRSQHGITPVHLAAMRGHLGVLKLLELSGAEMGARTDDGRTAETIAQYNGHKEIINFIHGTVAIRTAQRFLEERLEKKYSELSVESLGIVRHQGHNLKRHVIDALRELTIDINETLVELGSGPVTEATREPSMAM